MSLHAYTYIESELNVKILNAENSEEEKKIILLRVNMITRTKYLIS